MGPIKPEKGTENDSTGCTSPFIPLSAFLDIPLYGKRLQLLKLVGAQADSSSLEGSGWDLWGYGLLGGVDTGVSLPRVLRWLVVAP